MRADNKGEGGSLALLALINRTISGKKRWARGIVMLGVFATALFYGDSMITPAISVLSAVEGLTTVNAGLQPFVVPIALGILVGLFAIQSRGTARVGLMIRPENNVAAAHRPAAFVEASSGHRLFLNRAQLDQAIASGTLDRPVKSMLAVPVPLRFGDYAWDDSGVPAGSTWLRVDLRSQLISVFRGGHEIGTAVIVYGADGLPTPTGRFPILAKLKDHRSSTYDASMRADDEPSTAAADGLYEKLRSAGVETLYDDRDERGGVKLGSMDLIGLPWQVIIGPRGIAAGTIELKCRSTGEREELSIESALARLTS